MTGCFLPPHQTGLSHELKEGSICSECKRGTDEGKDTGRKNSHRAVCHRKIRETKLALKPIHLKRLWERGD